MTSRLPLAAALLALALPARALEIHYSPAENLERLDVVIIDGAHREIDMAAYVLTDWSIIEALARAAERGVVVRVYLDGTQLAEHGRSQAFEDLAKRPGVEMRVTRDRSAPMHLKSYEVDGQLLRTGSANFTASGEKRQDNDLVVIDNPDAAAIFKHEFEGMFAGGEKVP